MPKINVYLPDDLAEQVKARDLPVSPTIQRLLREEITRMQTIEQADDIKVFVQPKGDFPDGEDPNFNPERDEFMNSAAALLVHRPNRRYAGGLWTLCTVDGRFEEWPGPAESADDIEGAMSYARERIRLMNRPELDKLTVTIGEQRLTVGFEGRWLVHPDGDESRTAEGGYDNGAYWGVAQTGRGRIAVYTAHVNERWPATLDDYDSLDDLAEANVPLDIIAQASAELGEDRVLWRDI